MFFHFSKLFLFVFLVAGCFVPTEGCFLRYLSLNDDVCSVNWIISLSIMGLSFVFLILSSLLLANLYRTPWSNSMTTIIESPKKLLSTDEEESTTETVNICERCGTTYDVRPAVLCGGSSTVFLCTGCILYKWLLRSYAVHFFALPTAFMCWFFGLGGEIFVAEILCGISISVFVIVLIFPFFISNWRRVFAFMFARRATPDKGGQGESKWQRLNRTLDARSTTLLNRLETSSMRAHAKPIREILSDEEEIFWLESIPVSRYIRYNHDFQIMLWWFSSLPLVWGALGVFFLVYGEGLYEIAFGAWVTVFVVLLSTPYFVSSYLKCCNTYVLTNFRAMRVNTTLFWFANRVYSYPYYRMTRLYFVTFPEAQEGQVKWLESDDDCFGSIEYVSNTAEVENIIMQFKSLSLEGAAEIDKNRLKREAQALAVLQLLPLILMAFLSLLILATDLDWGLMLIVTIPAVWLSITLHLVYRKFNFLSKCSIKHLPLREGTLQVGSIN